jgi:hypothetical protein
MVRCSHVFLSMINSPEQCICINFMHPLYNDHVRWSQFLCCSLLWLSRLVLDLWDIALLINWCRFFGFAVVKFVSSVFWLVGEGKCFFWWLCFQVVVCFHYGNVCIIERNMLHMFLVALVTSYWISFAMPCCGILCTSSHGLYSTGVMSDFTSGHVLI